MNNLNMRKRILLGYMAPLLLMVMVSVTVVWSTQRLNELSSGVELAHEITSDLQDIQLAIAQMQRATRSIILANDERSRKGFEGARTLFNQKLESVRKQVKDPKQQERLQQIVVSNARLLEFMANLQNLVGAGKAPAAVDLYRSGTGVVLGDELDKLVDEFQKHETDILKARQLVESQASVSLVNMVLGLTTAAVLLGIFLGWWIASRISNALVEAVAGMSTSSSEIAATVDEHERVVTQQAAAVTETTTTIDELGASARQSASQAESAADAAKQAHQVTQDGIRLANQVSDSMVGMKEQVSVATDHIRRLSEQASQIGDIAKVVGELAGETNMLALNAAVEAAHAGEHGKGFAVVAAEVRKLADQSKKSAERANALVTEIQKATLSAVMATEEGSRTTDEVVAIIGQTVESFASIASAANSVAVNAQQMLLNSRQQAAALGQVTEAMKSLAAGSTQMAAGTTQTKQGVQKLNSVALGLKAMV